MLLLSQALFTFPVRSQAPAIADGLRVTGGLSGTEQSEELVTRRDEGQPLYDGWLSMWERS